MERFLERMHSLWRQMIATTLALGALGALGALLATGGAGCSGDDSASADAGPADTGSQVTCMTDPRRDEFTANLTKPGKSGAFQFVLVTVDPTPPALETNTWTVKILDAAGADVPDAVVTVAKPYMPLHLHSSSQSPQVATAPGGTFTVGNLNFFMVGLFRVTITAEAHGQTDSADFFFCVQ